MIRPTDDQTPLVPFVPFRCPNCKRHKPRTHGVRGRIRYHTCGACGTKYRSIELDPREWPHELPAEQHDELPPEELPPEEPLDPHGGYSPLA
jgi:hypothetical protein